MEQPTEKQRVTSKKYGLDWHDVAKGVLVAMLTAFAATGGQMMEQWLTTPDFAFDRVNLILSLKAAIGAGIAYLVKQFLTPQQLITTFKTLFLFLIIGSLASCGFISDLQKHNHVEITRVPKTPEDTVSFVWKFWGAQDLVQQYVPANTKATQFIQQSTKNCKVEIVSCPENLNDTLGFQFTCHHMYSTVKGLIPAKNATPQR